MSRTQLYLTGLLLVQVVLILVFRTPFSGTNAGLQARPLLPGLEMTNMNVIEFLKDDERLRLSREDGAWRVEQLGGFPADEQKVESLLGDLEALKVRRPVVSSNRYHDTFKVGDDEYEARLLLSAAAGDPAVDLFVGSSPNFRTAHVRLAGEDAVYEVQGLSSWDVRPDAGSWIDKALVDIDETSVVGLTLTNAAGTFELAREDGSWRVTSDPGRDLDAAAVDALVRTVSSLQLSDGIGPVDDAAHGLADPTAMLTLRWSEPAVDDDSAASMHEAIIAVGNAVADDESKRYVTRDGSGFTGAIWESSVQRLLEETLDGLGAS